MNELSLFEPEEKVMTTREIATVLNVSVDTVQGAIKHLSATSENFPKFRQGQTPRFNEMQVTAIKLELQNHSKVNTLTPKTNLENQLLIQQAMRIQQEMISELQQRAKVAESALARIENGKGCFTMNQTAKALKLPYGNITLFQKLRENGILNSDNTPKQEQINAGRFKVVVKVVENVGNKNVTLTTGKGLVYLAKRFNAEIDETVKADA